MTALTTPLYADRGLDGLGFTAQPPSAIRLLEMPAPIVADALSYHPVIAAKIGSLAGGSWSRYAAGDHTRTDDR
jgi:hypothetical protein